MEKYFITICLTALLTTSVFANNSANISKQINKIENKIEIRDIKRKIDTEKSKQADVLIKLGLLENYLESGYEAKFHGNQDLVEYTILSLESGAAITTGGVVALLSRKLLKTSMGTAKLVGVTTAVIYGYFRLMYITTTRNHLFNSYLKIRSDFIKKLERSDNEKIQKIYLSLQRDLVIHTDIIKELELNLADLE